jgi:hypothetical protein
MENFQHKTEDKLIILYVLDKIKTGLTREQIAFIILQNLQAAYLDIQMHIDALIAEKMIWDRSGKLIISSEGSAMIAQLIEKIPAFTREMLSAFIAGNKQAIFKETRTDASYDEAGPGDFQVHLGLSENHLDLMQISVSCPNKEEALALCEAWKNNTQKIYAQIMSVLIDG